MKIPFTLDAWLKDKSQKVETRNGRLVHNIWRIKEPTYTNNRRAEVCALIDGEEDALVFFEGGRYLPTTKDTDSPFDLFLITPEEEMTPFERGFLERVFHQKAEDLDEQNKEIFLEDARYVLALAREQFIKDGYVIEKKALHYAEELTQEIYKVDSKSKWKNIPVWQEESNELARLILLYADKSADVDNVNKVFKLLRELPGEDIITEELLDRFRLKTL